MKTSSLALALSLLLTSAVTVCSQSANPSIKRLDGSTIAPAEIDATVIRLMRAAKVTGTTGRMLI